MCNNKENAMNKVIGIVVDCCATDLGNGQKSLTRDDAVQDEGQSPEGVLAVHAQTTRKAVSQPLHRGVRGTRRRTVKVARQGRT